MDTLQTVQYDPKNLHLSDEEFLRSGHLACAGCGAALGMRLALKALGEKTIVVVPACCFAVSIGAYPFNAMKVPVLNVAFETAAVSAAGVRAGLDAQGKKDVTVLAWAGDGGTFDIGIQSLSGTVERNDNIIYVCYDNEAYMNTGIQRSSATPFGAWTTTTPLPFPKHEPKKDIVGILAEHRIPYAATATIAFPEDFTRKLQKAKSISGTKFLHLWVPCPTGHKSEERLSIRLSRLAVETGVFPLYEVERGVRYTINREPSFVDVNEYLRLQGRFRHLGAADIETIRHTIAFEWRRLRAKVRMGYELQREDRY
jgi:pyruvate ferredoxin oxidoreductase beta subunit/2-oxoisovalerate ferredoxin oxidoreductase beta subunit